MANSGGDGAVDGIGWRGLVGRGPLHRVRAMPSTKARAVVQGSKQKSWCRRWEPKLSSILAVLWLSPTGSPTMTSKFTC